MIGQPNIEELIRALFDYIRDCDGGPIAVDFDDDSVLSAEDRRVIDAAIEREMNDLAKLEGRYLGKTPWQTPRQPGSILDVPETPESLERIARLRERRRERERDA